MRLNLFGLVLLWMGHFVPVSLNATTIVPFVNLGEATTYSECVVLAKAVEVQTNQANGSIYQEMRFESLESIKGSLLPGDVFTVRPFSRSNFQYNLEIAGDFKPETGKTYLLFLYQQADFWRPVMLSYYTFEQIRVGADEYLVPTGGQDMEIVQRPDGLVTETLSAYHQPALIQHLQHFSTAPALGWNAPAGQHSPEALKAMDRAVPNGCDFKLGGPNLCRWENAVLPIYYDDTSNPAGWVGTFSDVLSAMTDNYAGISPSNAGAVDYDPDCVDGAIGFDSNFLDFCDNELNGPQSVLIIFDDPCNEIPNLNNCAGTLAFGGSYSSSDTHVFDGVDWDNALYGFVVVNNGAPGCLSGLQFEQVMSHELTHVYRMGHLNTANFPNQNMNPSCCNAINNKDRECMDYAYPPPAPVELLSFDAGLEGDQQVKLQWITASEKDNAFFTIQRASDGLQFNELQQINSLGNNTGGRYAWIDTRPVPGQNYYRLSQTDHDGTVQHLGIKAVSVGVRQVELNIFPNPIEKERMTFSVSLPAFFKGKQEVLAPDGRLIHRSTLSLDSGIHTLELPMNGIPEGIYLLRISDQQQFWTARFIQR